MPDVIHRAYTKNRPHPKPIAAKGGGAFVCPKVTKGKGRPHAVDGPRYSFTTWATSSPNPTRAIGAHTSATAGGPSSYA